MFLSAQIDFIANTQSASFLSNKKQERLQRCLQVYYAPRVTTTLIILIFEWIPSFRNRSLLALFARSLFKHIRLIPFRRASFGKHSHNGILNFSSVFFNRLPFVWQARARVCTQCHTALVAWFGREKNLFSFLSLRAGPRKAFLLNKIGIPNSVAKGLRERKQ